MDSTPAISITPRRRDGTLPLAFCLSLVVHGLLIAGVLLVVRHVASQPSVSVQEGVTAGRVVPDVEQISSSLPPPLPRLDDSTEMPVVLPPNTQTDNLLTLADILPAASTASMFNDQPAPLFPAGPHSAPDFVAQSRATLRAHIAALKKVAASPAGEQGPSGVSGGDPISASTNTPPPYPAEARRNRWEGTVWLSVTVTSEGSVADVAVDVSSGFRVLDLAALDAVRNWRFSPSTEDGVPVPSRGRVPVQFMLRGKP